ncbi:hypothetical protein GCM10017778_39050 [Streptomyces vinaceus]|nr:hypothetical protein GCM10017778_39050 [Streptomyces vinaceus]
MRVAVLMGTPSVRFRQRTAARRRPGAERYGSGLRAWLADGPRDRGVRTCGRETAVDRVDPGPGRRPSVRRPEAGWPEAERGSGRLARPNRLKAGRRTAGA